MNVRLSLSTDFMAGVYYQDRLGMNSYRLKLHMVTVSNDNNEQNIALDRVKYFIYDQLAHSIFINQALESQCKLLVDANLKITTLPEEPFDQVIGIMLYSKLNAIVEDRLVITEIEISSAMGDNIVYLHDDAEQLGPFAQVGWWNETDASHYDTTLYATDKIVAINPSVTWKDIGLAWNQEVADVIDDNRVLFADFQKDDSR